MFTDVDEKLKKGATALVLIAIVLGFLSLVTYKPDSFGSAVERGNFVVTTITGVIALIVSAFFMYGFGEILTQLKQLNKNMAVIQRSIKTQSPQITEAQGVNNQEDPIKTVEFEEEPTLSLTEEEYREDVARNLPKL